MGYYRNETTTTDEIIAFLFSCRSDYIRKQILWERVKTRRNISTDTYKKSILRLKNRGIVKEKDNKYLLSPKGILFYKNHCYIIKTKINKQKKIILIFDIPENKKKVRDWIRNQIKFWDFKMIQKSVWTGYGPLPKEFNERLKILGVDKGIRIFNVQSP